MSEGSAQRRRLAVSRSARNAALVAPPSPDMERQGATALAIAMGVTTDQQLVDMAREVWSAMAAQRAKEMETA